MREFVTVLAGVLCVGCYEISATDKGIGAGVWRLNRQTGEVCLLALEPGGVVKSLACSETAP